MSRAGDPSREQRARAAHHEQLASEARELLEALDSQMEWRRDDHEGARNE